MVSRGTIHSQKEKLAGAMIWIMKLPMAFSVTSEVMSGAWRTEASKEWLASNVEEGEKCHLQLHYPFFSRAMSYYEKTGNSVVF